MEKKIILHLCADTGSDSKPYADNDEYEVILVGSETGVENFRPMTGVYGIFANPVCTEFSIATGFNRQGDHEKGLFLVRECQRIIAECDPVFWVVENPASGHLKDYLGEPTMTYEPWHYGSPWTKKTALWGKFNKPERLYRYWEDVPAELDLYIRPGRTKPSLAFMHKSAAKLIPEFAGFNPDSDMEFRSLCSQKFAQAFYEVNQ